MAHKNPVVVSADGKKHETLGDGDTIAPGSVPVSAESGNGLSVKPDGLFSTAGGGGGLSEVAHNNSLSGAGTTGSPLSVRISGRADNAIQFLDLATTEGGLFAALASSGLPAVPQTVVDSDIPSTTVHAAMQSLLQNPAKAAASTQWNNVTYTAFPAQKGQIRVTAIPADTGKYMLIGGDLNHPEQDVVIMSWVSDDGTELTTFFESENKGPIIDGSLQGDGVVGSLGVRLSKTSDNGLSLRDDGLFASRMTRGTGGGNWSFGYPDSPWAKNACGKMGSGVYWKTTADMPRANVGDVNVKLDVWIKNLPCMEDGTLVSHRIIIDYATATTSTKPTAAIWLICDTAPTHMINLETKTVIKLQRNPESQTTGLPEYPTAPDGEFAQEFTYSRQYFYMA
jgi:hypothetical protein